MAKNAEIEITRTRISRADIRETTGMIAARAEVRVEAGEKRVYDTHAVI
jgi:hypothetical protein